VDNIQGKRVLKTLFLAKGMIMRITRKTICPLDCPDTCGMLATVAEGKVVSLAGDPDHPYTQGFICRKMRGYPDRLYSSHRILYPQRRVAKKGEGRFKRISWDEAWDYMVPRMQEIMAKYGGSSILPFSYAGNMGMVNRFAGFPLFHKMGTLQTQQTICSAAANGGWKLICGEGGGSPPSEAEEAKLIIAWGINIRVTNVHFWRYVKKARAAGGRLLVIDPYRNDTARVADDYIQVHPGGDAALALGILKVLIDKGWIDQEFISSESEGFEQLADYVGQLPIDRIERDSGVTFEQICQIAALLHEHPQTFIRIGIGLTRNSRGGMAIRAIVSLAAACGLFDGQPGRGVLLFSGAFSGDQTKLTFPELAEKPVRWVNMIHLGQVLTATDPSVKSLIVYNANPVSVAPDGSSVRKGLGREDLFTIVHEQVMSPTARFADLLLPATTFLENRDLYTAYGHFYFGTAPPVIEPLGESMSNFDFFQTFAQKMGYADSPFHQSLDQRLHSYLVTIQGAQSSFSVENFRDGDYVESRFNSSDGPVLRRKNSFIRFVNDDDPTVPPFACLFNAAEFDHPDLRCRFPFRLITPPDDKLLNSTFGERYAGHKGRVLVNPEDAAAAGVRDGEEIIMSNFRGSTVRIAKVTGDTRKGLLVAEGIYWPAPTEEGGINDLVSQQCSDVGGGALFHESRVQIAPAFQTQQQ
jgi:anaerobic selenocysteine-containing dehydrogenase